MTNLKLRYLLAGAALIGLVWTSSAQAKEEKGEGKVAYVILSSTEFQMPDGRTARRIHQRGTILAEDPASSIHKSSQDCFGTMIMSADGPPAPGYGYCDGVDTDGDLWTIWWKNESGGGSNWGFLGGTGKFKGVEGGGTTKTELQSPDGRMLISWQGKWTLK